LQPYLRLRFLSYSLSSAATDPTAAAAAEVQVRLNALGSTSCLPENTSKRCCRCYQRPALEPSSLLQRGTASSGMLFFALVLLLHRVVVLLYGALQKQQSK